MLSDAVEGQLPSAKWMRLERPCLLKDNCANNFMKEQANHHEYM